MSKGTLVSLFGSNGEMIGIIVAIRDEASQVLWADGELQWVNDDWLEAV